MDTEPLGQRVEIVIANLPPGGVTVTEIQALVGREGLMLLTICLTLVFLVPVSIPGVSTVFGSAILLIGVSRLIGRDLWLPRFVAYRTVPTARLRSALHSGMKWFGRIERVSRPHRLAGLSRAGLMRVINDIGMIFASILLMFPFGLIPFSNTLPAVALLLFAVGFLQRDGVLILLGHLMNLATILYFGILFASGGVAIRETLRFLGAK